MGKQKCGEKKGTANDPKAYGLVCKAWWRWCRDMGMHGILNFNDDLMYDDSSRMNLEGYKTILPSNIQ